MMGHGRGLLFGRQAQQDSRVRAGMGGCALQMNRTLVDQQQQFARAQGCVLRRISTRTQEHVRGRAWLGTFHFFIKCRIEYRGMSNATTEITLVQSILHELCLLSLTHLFSFGSQVGDAQPNQTYQS